MPCLVVSQVGPLKKIVRLPVSAPDYPPIYMQSLAFAAEIKKLGAATNEDGDKLADKLTLDDVLDKVQDGRALGLEQLFSAGCAPYLAGPGGSQAGCGFVWSTKLDALGNELATEEGEAYEVVFNMTNTTVPIEDGYAKPCTLSKDQAHTEFGYVNFRLPGVCVGCLRRFSYQDCHHVSVCTKSRSLQIVPVLPHVSHHRS